MKEQKRRKATSSRFRQIPHPRVYGDHDVELSSVKINVHIRLDGDVVSYFKEKAKQEGSKYQTLMNQYLRTAIFKQRNLEDRLDHIEQRLGIQ